MTTPARLPTRRIRFEYPDDLDPNWVPNLPELAYAANSVSLIMPYAEPYFVRSVRAVLPQLEGDLHDQTGDYARQELQHSGQHRKFNELIEARYPKVRRLEGWMRRCYGWLGRTRSTKFNLAFAAGSEAIAYGLARWTDKHMGTLFAGADPVAATLFAWHLAEEVEHKSAAFDVYEELDGSRLRYAFAMVLSLVLLGWFVWVGTLIMLRADGRLFSPVAHFRLARLALSMVFDLFPMLLVSALPGHHPRDLTDPVFLTTWLRHYDPATGTMPLWTAGAGTGAGT